MVDVNLVRELETGGMAYQDAFKVANLMDSEGLSRKEAIDRVLAEKEAADKNNVEKLKAENKEKAKAK